MITIKDVLEWNHFIYENMNEEYRRSKAELTYSFLVSNSYLIKEALIDKMLENGKVEAPRDWELTTINLLPKITRNLNMLYSDKDKVFIEVVNKEGIVDQTATDRYNYILEKYNINRYKKDALRGAITFNTILVGPKIRDNQLELDLLYPHQCSIMNSSQNYLKMRALTVDYEDEAGEVIYQTITPENIIVVNAKEEIVSNNPNEYAVIPYVVYRIEDKGDFWGEGLNEVVDLNNEINVQLTSLSTNGLYQGGSILFGVNVSENGVVKVGPNSSLQVIESPNNKVTPSLSYITPDPKIDQLITLINFYIKQAYIGQGLSSTQYDSEGKDESGIAKYINNVELQERRKDFIDASILFEKKLFSMLKIVYNKAIEDGELEGDPIVGDDVKVSYLQESISSLSDKEKYELTKMKLNDGILSIYDIVREEYGDTSLTDEECKKIVDDNKEINNIKILPIIDSNTELQ